MTKSIVVGGAYAIGILRVPMRMPDGTMRIVSVMESAPVFGEAIQLKPNEHDIEEMAMVVNLNFHTWSKKGAVEYSLDLPGPSAV